MKSGDPVKQEKQLKYATLVANTIMLSNVADMTDVLAAMIKDDHPFTSWVGRLTQVHTPANTSAGSANTSSI